ncbi:MAG: enoyl-CoA hydratase-related protein [Parvibaculaceae bacterium]
MTANDDGRVASELLYKNEDGIATLTLNRPEVRNAVTAGVFLELERLLREIEADDAVRVVVLTGAGKGFCAGADLRPEPKEVRSRALAPAFPGDAGGDILERANRCLLRMRRLPKPILGCINGDAVGIGCCLALATDLRIASEKARLGVVFSRIGLGPDGGASYFLQEAVSPAKALELLFLGDIVVASDALKLGLVNRVVAPDDLTNATLELAARLACGPTIAYGVAKAAVYEGKNLGLEHILDLEARNQKIAGRSHDAREGVQAFRERREPRFRAS